MSLNRKIDLLCITCPRDDISYEQQVELACQGGADMIQLRDKKMYSSNVNIWIKFHDFSNRFVPNTMFILR